MFIFRKHTDRVLCMFLFTCLIYCVLFLHSNPVKGNFSNLTMRRSPRRPLILKRRKLPFLQNEPTQADKQTQHGAAGTGEPTKPAASQCLPHGIPIMNHPSMSDTQVVVIPKEADLQSIIGVLTAKGKESGVQGPNKFILLSESGSRGNGSFCQATVKEESSPAGSTSTQPVKSDTIHNMPDAKPLTGNQSSMYELRAVASPSSRAPPLPPSH